MFVFICFCICDIECWEVSTVQSPSEAVPRYSNLSLLSTNLFSLSTNLVSLQTENFTILHLKTTDPPAGLSLQNALHTNVVK